MLDEVFYWILNMSILASLYGILLYFLRYIKRIPKIVIYFLWGIVLYRMLCPAAFISRYSLMSITDRWFRNPVIRTIPVGTQLFSLSNSIQAADSYQPISYKTMELQKFFSIASVIWMVTTLAAIIITVLLYRLAAARLNRAVRIEENIYEGNMVTTPMISGILHSKIILPPGIKEEEKRYILTHERIHGKRHDNLWRMLAILAACIHWFNPLSWLFLKVFVMDCELACDEAAVKKLGLRERKEYAAAMLSYADTENQLFSPSFGSGLKLRIQNVLTYRRLTWYSFLAFLLMTGVMAFLLLTN